MNRVIKFRAWNDKGKFMINESSTVPRYVGFNGIVISITEGMSGDDYRPSIRSEKIERMQFTGLKDENNNDIYEGDICKAFYEEEEHIVKILWGEEWDHPAFDAYKKNATNNWVIPFNEECNSLSDPNVIFIVIGNIYENQELVE